SLVALSSARHSAISASALAFSGEAFAAVGVLVKWVGVMATSAGGGPSGLSSIRSAGFGIGAAGAFSVGRVIAATFVAGALRLRALAASISARSLAGRSLMSQTVYGPWSLSALWAMSAAMSTWPLFICLRASRSKRSASRRSRSALAAVT